MNRHYHQENEQKSIHQKPKQTLWLHWSNILNKLGENTRNLTGKFYLQLVFVSCDHHNHLSSPIGMFLTVKTPWQLIGCLQQKWIFSGYQQHHSLSNTLHHHCTTPMKHHVQRPWLGCQLPGLPCRVLNREETKEFQW